MSKRTYRSHYLRTGLVLKPTQHQEIERVLAKLHGQILAYLILLTDITGQIVTSRGNQDDMDLVALGSLVAGDLAASHEIARLTHQYQADQLIFREGTTVNTFTCEVGFHLALLVQASPDTPLGWARMLIRRTAKELAEITTQPDEEPTGLPAVRRDQLALPQEEDWPDLFNDALDDLWLE